MDISSFKLSKIWWEIFIGMDIYELKRREIGRMIKRKVCPSIRVSMVSRVSRVSNPLSPAAIYNESDTRKFELSPVIIMEASSRHNFILGTVIWQSRQKIGRCFVQINFSLDLSESLMLFYSGIENRQINYLNCLFSGLAKSQRLEIFYT